MPNRELHRVQKIGSSLGVTLPAAVCRALGIARGDMVSFAVYSENEVVVRRLTPDDLKALQPKFIT